MEEPPHIEGYRNTNIHENFNLTPQILTVDYADMVLPITKSMQSRNEYCTINNKHRGTIWRHHFKDQYQIVCVIRTSKPSIHRRSISMWVFTYSIEYHHIHNYKWNLIHSTCTNYMAIISYRINLGQTKTSITRTSRYYLIAKNPDQTST